MTSSLVGSEMCIRDSVRRSGGRRVAVGLLVKLLQHPEVLLDRVMACLLYTSDAADEQCVDLGGR
eukprot:928096-Prorocentrum_lima.AAC.1